MRVRIAQAVKLMKKGGIVIYPTESSYAIGCDATNPVAARKIRKLKGRKSGKYFPIIVSDIRMAKKYYKIDENIERVTKLGVTIVCRKRRKMPYIGGFRISKIPAARNLSKRLNRPIIATSANISGQTALYSPKEMKNIFSGIPIIDAGTLKKRRPSTVYDYENRRLLRKGPVSLKRIEKAFKTNKV